MKGKLDKLTKRIRASVQAWQDYPLKNGSVVGKRYELVRFLGMGSYGQAYEALDLMSGQPVLVKLSKPSKGETSRTLLARESDLMQSLSHPQIPRWLDYVTSGRRHALVMELIPGDNLETLMLDQGRLYDERAVVQIMQALLAPLIHLHEQGYVHRDVRIPNVMLHEDHSRPIEKRIYLIDYGLACRIMEELPESLREALGEGSLALAEDISWGDVKRRMRHPEPSSDLYGTGHFALFLLYSGYTPKEGEPPGDWQTELALSEAMRQWIRRSLGEGEPFVSARDSAAALAAIVQQQPWE